MKGRKTCPSCNAEVGARLGQCSCGHTFNIGSKTPKSVGVPGETIEQAIERVKQFKAKQASMPKVKKTKVVRVAKPVKTVENHKILAPGDKIKVISGGSYWKNTADVKVHIGYRGKFTVKAVDQHGIFAYGNKKEGDQSMCYIWMGRNLLTKAGVHRRAHKVVKIGN